MQRDAICKRWGTPRNSNPGNPFKCSITGGYRYRGSSQNTLQGLYFFADFCSGDIGYIEETSPNPFQLTFANTFNNHFSSFAEDVNGELYIMDLYTGVISKVIDANLSVEEENFNTVKIFPNPAQDYVSIHTGHIQATSIRIINIEGKHIKTITDFSNEEINISIQDLEKGFYIMEITSISGYKNIEKLIIN